MTENNVNNLSEEEVNAYGDINYECGKVQLKCVTDCPFSTPWMTEDH
ncbi:hypothetical protein NXH76_27145 [Blautia schinkii]|nr:hypothetical protein [Blautia schinkii]